jgi:hypothetical protein
MELLCIQLAAATKESRSFRYSTNFWEETLNKWQVITGKLAGLPVASDEI